MSILDNLKGLRSVSTVEAKVPMSPEQVKNLSTKLRDSNRVNVYPNRFDIKRPFRVQIRHGKEYTQHGYFSDVDVASAIGTLVSAAVFGNKAVAGEFDQAKAEAHPEFQAWLEDSRNQEVLAKVGMV